MLLVIQPGAPTVQLEIIQALEQLEHQVEQLEYQVEMIESMIMENENRRIKVTKIPWLSSSFTFDLQFMSCFLVFTCDLCFGSRLI